MLTFTTGNIWESKAEVIVIPVNCVGVMGKGLAKQCAIRYPELETQYKVLCGAGLINVGDCYHGMTVERYKNGMPKLTIALAPTKKHWRDPSRIEWVEQYIACSAASMMGYKGSAAFPALGCGLGGLDWEEVKGWFEHHFDDHNWNITVYEPQGG